MRRLAAVTPLAAVAPVVSISSIVSTATVVPSVVAAIVPVVAHVVLGVTAMTPGVPIPIMPMALVAAATVVPPITVAVVPVVTVAVAVVAIAVPVHLMDDGEGEREGQGRQRQVREELHPRAVAAVVVRECGRRRSESDQHGRTQDQHCEAAGAPRLRISNVSVALHDGSFLPELPVPMGGSAFSGRWDGARPPVIRSGFAILEKINDINRLRRRSAGGARYGPRAGFGGVRAHRSRAVR